MSDEAFEDKALIDSAKEAAKGSFSPMSGFAVGSALLIEDEVGKKHIVQGTNYETQNYTSVCAEKHALQSATLTYSKNNKKVKYLKIAICSPDNYDFTFPCGDCRQALLEQNPKMEVICASSTGEYKKFLAEELLPHGFSLSNSIKPKCEVPEELKSIYEYIVHFPIFEHKLSMLSGIKSMLVVGSPARAEKLAKSLLNVGDFGKGTYRCYCHLKNGDTDREYSLFVVEWQKPNKPKDNFKIAIASHGIGASGVEAVLSEVNALVALANGSAEEIPIKNVIRSGTRGTIEDLPLGTVAISTETYNETDSSKPCEKLIDQLKKAADSMDIEIQEGPCLSTQFFWSGQGRTPFPLLKQDAELQQAHDKHLRSLKAKGIKWVEMEDYYINYFADKFGMKSASIGVVVAKRYDAKQDKFVLHYDKDTSKDKELLPAHIALLALKNISGFRKK